VTPSTNTSAKALLLRTTLVEEKTYCLMVIGDNVTVLHAIMEPFELQALGGKFVAFAGDIRKVVNQIIHPDLVELSEVTCYYALRPPELFASGRFVRTSDDWQMFEQSECDGNLTLEERKNNQKAGELISGTPRDQMNTICHLEGVATRYNFFFMEQCPVVAYLLWFARKLSSDPTMTSWKEDHWKTFNWHVHIALRKVWTSCSNGIGKEQLAYLTRIQSDLNSGCHFSIDDCPPELRNRKRDAKEAGLGKPQKMPPMKNNLKEKSPPVINKSPIMENFVTLCQSAKDAIVRSCEPYGLHRYRSFC